MKIRLLFLFLFCSFSYSQAQNFYFPPQLGTAWDTLSPSNLNWCQPRIDSLLDYLEDKNTKAFIVLKEGKMVIEEYFDSFTRDSLWYWASAGKTLTSFLIGQAQEEGYLNLTDTTSQYLGNGWTSLSPTQEAAITIRHQLTMTTGLDDGVNDVHCTDDTCLQYLAAPGTRWAYHNAPYTLLGSVLESATGVTRNQFTTTHLKARTGMTGLWVNTGYNRVYFSNARSMARFGLLILNRGIWQNDTLLHDTNYFDQMVNTSQNLNLSYGYLWWLNGKGSHMLPSVQVVFPGDLIPDAPADLIAALGKNDQKIYVVPSMGLVVIRMGNSAGQTALAASSFDTELWEKIMNLNCTTTQSAYPAAPTAPILSPNPSQGIINLQVPHPNLPYTLSLHTLTGKILITTRQATELDISQQPSGIYFLRLKQGSQQWTSKIIKD